MRSRDEVVKRIASEIEQWLADKPDAADTVEGIRDYWLTEANRHQPRQLVQEALESLVARGIVREQRQRPGVPSMYGGPQRGLHRKNG